MTETTVKNKTLANHIYHSNGAKTVCVTTCLNFFGIPFNAYRSTSSNKDVRLYESILRRFGYSVRSRISELKIKKGCSLTNVKKSLRKSLYGSNDYFIVFTYQAKTAHLIVLDGNGTTIVDTHPRGKWKVATIDIVFK